MRNSKGQFIKGGFTGEAEDKRKKAISKAMMGNKNQEKHKSKETREKIGLANKFSPKIRGEKHYLWKGEDVGYFALHAWIQRQKGKAQKCIDCGTIKGKIEHSSKDHEYKRKVEDYQSRCVPCHRKYDFENGLISYDNYNFA